MQISKKDKSRNTFAFSSDELITFIKEQKFDKSLIIEIEEMLRLGDGLEFAESSSQELDFKDLRRKVSEILKKLSWEFFIFPLLAFWASFQFLSFGLAQKNSFSMTQ